LPLAHINAQVVGLLATLVSGATIVLDDRFHRRGFWATMARRRITWVNAVPAILARLAMLEEGEVVPDGIRFARSASAPLAVPVLERFERATGIPVVETYGMTEAASQITANPLHGPRKPGSVGLPVGTEVRVVPGGGDTGDAAAAPGEVGRVQGSHRDDLRAVPDTVAAPGEVGRVLVRGPSVIRAYVSPGYEDRIDADGWLDTGDLGYRDGAGFLFLVGRADDVINRGGEKVYPLEVESVVLGDPQVTSVAVAGRDDEALGRVPVAYLVVDGVGGPDDERLAAAVAARVHRRCTRLLSRPKRPVAYHVVDRLPQGATGKVRRGALAGATPLFSLLVS
jgi:acyl-CoA synthetase (AMP-forming)/AMP-acid ligase II